MKATQRTTRTQPAVQMGALGHSRRSGRSPLLIVALVACVLVLGFNYWVCSSRNLDLQTQLFEMETQVRRAAAERGVSEMKSTEFKEEIQRRKEQTEKMEKDYQRRMEGERDHKVLLQQNISSSTKALQELNAQLNQVNNDVGVLQRELQSCQSAIKTLNNKLTYDMTQCHSQVLSQKELCDERVTGVKVEAQKKLDKLLSAQVKTLKESLKATVATAHTEAALHNSTHAVTVAPLSNQSSSKPPAAATHLPLEDAIATHLPPAMHLPLEGAAATHLPLEGAAATHLPLEDATATYLPPEGTAATHLPPEGAAATHLPPEGAAATVDRELQLSKAKPFPTDDPEGEDLADYNGDEENEGELEADKQAALKEPQLH